MLKEKGRYVTLLARRHVLPLVSCVAYECYRRRWTTTDAREHYWSGPPTLCVGRPVIKNAE